MGRSVSQCLVLFDQQGQESSPGPLRDAAEEVEYLTGCASPIPTLEAELNYSCVNYESMNDLLSSI